jgi:hypothetical protein
MNYTELNNALAELNIKVAALEDLYIENGGEVTPDTQAIEAEISELKMFLSTEGVDMLGRWLKQREDEKKNLKAEKDYLTRRITQLDRTTDFIKGRLAIVMDAAGVEKVKGEHGYSFTRTTSGSTTIDKDCLNGRYGEVVNDMREAFHIPEYITLTLGASVSKATAENIVEDDRPIFHTEYKDTITFRKPRASKED